MGIYQKIVLAVKRKTWVKDIRDKLGDHEKAREFLSTKSRKKCLCANRRAGKTTTLGTEVLARCIEQDNYHVWVFAGDLVEHSRNWITKRPTGAIAFLQEIGVPEEAYSVTKTGKNIVREIEFAWGSKIEIFSAKDLAQVNKARGGNMHLIWLDEAQKIRFLLTILVDVAGAAGADYEAEVWLSGTPDEDEQGPFAKIARGEYSTGWIRAQFYSWDNPFFGASFQARFQKAVVNQIVDAGVSEVPFTDEQVKFLKNDVTREIAEDIESHDIGNTLPDAIKREFFGCWVKNVASHIFTVVESMFWGDFAPHPDKRSRGQGNLQDLISEPDAWLDRIKMLPRIPGKTKQVKNWIAVLGIDFGFSPDPFALVCWLFSHFHEAAFELGSGKATQLTSDEQFSAVEAWVTRLREIGIHLKAGVADATGGSALSTTKAWEHKLDRRLAKVPLIPADKSPGSVNMGILVMNRDTARNRIMVLRNSPLHMEMDHLQWKLHPTTRKRSVDDKRTAVINGSPCIPGDHCCDAGRYAYMWVTNESTIKREKTTPETFTEYIQRQEMKDIN